MLRTDCDRTAACHVECLVQRTGENIGGGCAHFCGSIRPLSHPYYGCYPGARESIRAVTTVFALWNESSESIGVTLTYGLSPTHEASAQSDCLDVAARLSSPDRIGTPEGVFAGVRPTMVLAGNARHCTAAIDVPSGEVLLHGTRRGYWVSEIEDIRIRSHSGEYTVGRAELRRLEAPKSGGVTWLLWRYPTDR